MLWYRSIFYSKEKNLLNQLSISRITLPLIWLLQLITLLLSFPAQLVLWAVIGIGHFISLILLIVFQLLLFYVIAPGFCILLIVKRVRGAEISVLSIVFFIICTAIYYLLLALPSLV